MKKNYTCGIHLPSPVLMLVEHGVSVLQLSDCKSPIGWGECHRKDDWRDGHICSFCTLTWEEFHAVLHTYKRQGLLLLSLPGSPVAMPKGSASLVLNQVIHKIS